MCRGPHLPDTSKVQAMCVLKNSSAYWLGKSENPSLQRVYGISFPNKQLLTVSPLHIIILTWCVILQQM
jgi:threonyl-tRNA synthetase